MPSQPCSALRNFASRVVAIGCEQFQKVMLRFTGALTLATGAFPLAALVVQGTDTPAEDDFR
jgi:hypothetical protein